MPQNGYSIGRDFTLDVIKGNGAVLRIKVKTGYTARQQVKEEVVERLDGVTDYLNMPKGWGGTIEYDRQDDEIDAYFAQWEADYHAGRNQPNLTMTETITNPGGGITQYRFVGVALKYEDTGNKNGQSVVKGRLGWNASRRLKIR
jgi:hypothetical protein